MTIDSEKGLLAWLATHPVAGNLLMFMLVIGGVVQFSSVRQAVFPSIELNQVMVRVAYRGASPEEVVDGVVLPIEEAIRSVEDIDEISASAREGEALITAKIESGANASSVLRDIKNAVDAVTSFPVDAERPVVSIPIDRNKAMTIVVYGDVDRQTLRGLTEQLRAELLSSDDISLITESGLPTPEISVEVPLAASRQYGLSLPEIARRIGGASVDVPAGRVTATAGETLIRIKERRDTGVEYENIVLRTDENGGQVRVGDIATVVDGFRETQASATYDGVPAVSMRIYSTGDQKPIDLSKAARAIIDRVRSGWPDSVGIRIARDETNDFRDRISLMLENGALGLLLVVIVLGIFLHPQLAFWAAIGIPITFFAAFAAMPILDVSLNQISLFGFILTLGIVVDDAIVIGESVFSERRKGLAPIAATIRGTRVVAMPVIFAVTTTILAFMPLLFIPRPAGDFFKNIPLVVIPILVMSLIECLVILPAHLAHIPRGAEDRAGGWFAGLFRAQQRFSRRFEAFAETRVRAFVEMVVRLRYLTLALSFSMLLIAIGLVAGGFFRFEFVPPVEENSIVVSVELPFGTSEFVTREELDRLELDARVSAAALADESGTDVNDVLLGIYSEIGLSQVAEGPGSSLNVSPTGGHMGYLQVYLTEQESRAVSAQQFAEHMRKRVGDRPGFERLAFTYNVGPATGPAVALRLAHRDEDTLKLAAAELGRSLAEFDGVYDVNDGFGRGKSQLDLTLTDEGRRLGLTESELASQVRAAFFGAEAVRQQRDRFELRVYVRRPKAERSSEYFFEDLMIRTPLGGEVPLSAAATISRGESFTSIVRLDGSQVITVTADVDKATTTTTSVFSTVERDIAPELAKKYPGLSFSITGVQEIEGDAIGALGKGFVLALVGIFALLALAFRSYLQPIIIMISIPFGLIGALLGHLLLGLTLSIISLFGIVALSGVVINDGLVLVATINRYWQEGRSVRDAVVDGTVRRFRPVVLTSLTTFVGLAPLMFEQSLQASFVIPMAVSLGFGVLIVTVIAIAIIPATYVALDDARRSIAGRKQRMPYAETTGHE